MKVNLMSCTQNPIEVIYKAYKTCYSKVPISEIKIPQKITSVNGGYDARIEIGRFPESDESKMLEYIESHIEDESPLEHVSFTFGIDGVSRALTHQLVRHRLASYSQQSQRYVQAENFSYVTPKTILQHDKWRNVHIEDDNGGIDVNMDYDDMIKTIFNMYDTLTNDKISKEDARYVLPNATTTNIVVTMNVRELIHFFQLRCCNKAQWEIRDMAKKMRRQVQQVLPLFDNIMPCGKTCNECKDIKN